VYRTYGHERIIHWLDMRVVRAWDWIREERGRPIYINTWGINKPDWYPQMVDRGLRWIGESNTGSQTSQHYFGRAIDGDEVGTPNQELYDWILSRQDNIMEFGVTTIENIEYTRTWIHLDCRNWGHPNLQELNIVSP
jgi:hypothetical protein